MSASCQIHAQRQPGQFRRHGIASFSLCGGKRPKLYMSTLGPPTVLSSWVVAEDMRVQIAIANALACAVERAMLALGSSEADDCHEALTISLHAQRGLLVGLLLSNEDPIHCTRWLRDGVPCTVAASCQGQLGDAYYAGATFTAYHPNLADC